MTRKEHVGPDTVARFWGKVAISSDSECWRWTASKDGCGYGYIGWSGKNMRAHRMSWTIKNGPIPVGIYVCHRCDNPSCVNPSHLFLGTQKDNMRDCLEKGRYGRAIGKLNGMYTKPWRRAIGKRNGAYTKPHRIRRGKNNGSFTKPWMRPMGERNGRSKLAANDIADISSYYKAGVGTKLLAHAYGVSKSTIERVVNGKSWQCLRAAHGG